MDKEIGKILIVDDDEDVLLAAKMLLKKHAHHVTIEKNPNKIPFLLNNDSFDVILLDLSLPDSMGLETFDQACQAGADPSPLRHVSPWIPIQTGGAADEADTELPAIGIRPRSDGRHGSPFASSTPTRCRLRTRTRMRLAAFAWRP